MPGGVPGDALSSCTLETCPIDEYGLLDYLPSLAGNAFYVAIFAIVLAPQLFLGIRYKTWGYLVGMAGGLILEVLGYVSRILLHNNIYSLSFFVMNICCLTLGPAWFSGAIYVCLSRIIHIYGETLSPIRPRTITIVFITCDVVSMSLQAVGGALTSSADTEVLSNQGVDIMIAGLSFQVATTVGFVVVCTWLFFAIRRNPSQLNIETTEYRKSRAFRVFLVTITTATITILIRCCYRLAELSQGYDSAIANDEVSFMILEGAMMVICVLALTVGHPGPILREKWQVGKFSFKSSSGASKNGRSMSETQQRPVMEKMHSDDTEMSSESGRTMVGMEETLAKSKV